MVTEICSHNFKATNKKLTLGSKYAIFAENFLNIHISVILLTSKLSNWRGNFKSVYRQ